MPPLSRRKQGKFGVSFSGIEQLTRELSRDGEVWKRVQQGAVDGMVENTEDLLGRAMRDAPVDEGTLRGSGTTAVYANGRAVARRGLQEVGSETYGLSQDELSELKGRFGDRAGASVPEFEMRERRAVHEGGVGDAVVGEVGFNTPYALVQHERLDFNHPKGGKAKYLEENLTQQAGRYQENLASHLQEALK
ncbi:MAG: hypothetical protein ACE149_06780 [Armatimonadota bacterium]